MRTILFIVRKEILQVVRDRMMLVQIFVPPLLQLLIVAQAMTYEVKLVDLALVDLDQSPASERLIEQFIASGRFDATVVTASGDEADAALLTREAGAVLRIPDDFERMLVLGASPTVQLVLNAEDGAAAGVIQSYAGQIIAAFSQSEIASSVARPAVMQPGVAVQTRTLYNPQKEYLGYMAIGLLASLMTLVGILLTSQNIAREKEIGTLEQLNVTPITRGQFIVGKLIPFWLLGFVELILGLLIIGGIFRIPFEGALGWVFLGTGVYLLAALGLGLLISTVVSTQQQAMFITFFVLVTLLFLGGIFTPIQSMPAWAQVLAEANPIKHFVELLRTVLMKGGGLAEVGHQLVAMALFATVALGAAVVRYRKTVS